MLNLERHLTSWTTCDAFHNYVYEESLQVNAHVLCLHCCQTSINVYWETFIGKIVFCQRFFLKRREVFIIGKEGKLIVYGTKNQHIQHAHLCFNINSNNQALAAQSRLKEDEGHSKIEKDLVKYYSD